MSGIVCDGCHGAGWMLDANPSHEPISLELIPCVMPECTYSGRPVAALAIGGVFSIVVRHPASGSVMSLGGFQWPGP